MYTINNSNEIVWTRTWALAGSQCHKKLEPKPRSDACSLLEPQPLGQNLPLKEDGRFSPSTGSTGPHASASALYSVVHRVVLYTQYRVAQTVAPASAAGSLATVSSSLPGRL